MKKYFNHDTREIWIGIVVGLVSIAYLLGTTFIQRTDIISAGAEFMPIVYGCLLLLVSICQIISGGVQYGKSRAAHMAQTVENKAEPSPPLKKTALKPVIQVLLLIAVCVAIMPRVGFIVAGCIMTFGMCILLTPYYAKRQYVIFFIFSIVISGFTYFLFKNVLYVSLPAGILFS